MANKKDKRLGFYVLSLDQDDPSKKAEYLICWSNKLDIGSCDLNIMIENDGTESIVVSYKMININTYNVFVIDLKNEKLI